MAARADAANQVIPTMWVIEAQKRWTPKPPPGVPMCAIAADASGGGRDPIILQTRDRKSVGKGQSVSVSVDLGGRRNIKIKTVRKTTNESTTSTTTYT